MFDNKGTLSSLEAAVALEDLKAGGPGSGWFREAGHVSNAPGGTIVMVTDVKNKNAANILNRAGWVGGMPNAHPGEYVHPDMPGHMIKVFEDKSWRHTDPHGNTVAMGQNKPIGEAKRKLAVHLNRILLGRPVAGVPIAKQRQMPQGKPRAPKAAPVNPPAARAFNQVQPGGNARIRRFLGDEGWQEKQPRIFEHKDLPGHEVQLVGDRGWIHKAPGAAPNMGEGKEEIKPLLHQVERGAGIVRNAPAPKALAAAPPVPVFEAKTPTEKGLMDSPVVSIKPMRMTENKAEGVNGSYKVTLANGLSGVLKPANEEEFKAKGYQMRREQATYQIAKIVGMEDMHPVTVAKTVGSIDTIDKNGDPHVVSGQSSIQLFMAGTQANQVPMSERFDGDKDSARTAVFDWVIGNSDRHGGNWLVSGQQNLVLVDHGFTIPETHKFGGWGRGFVQKNSDNKVLVPKNEVAKYTKNIEKIVDKLTEMGLSHTAINGVRTRVAQIEQVENFHQLTML